MIGVSMESIKDKVKKVVQDLPRTELNIKFQ